MPATAREDASAEAGARGINAVSARHQRGISGFSQRFSA